MTASTHAWNHRQAQASAHPEVARPALAVQALGALGHLCACLALLFVGIPSAAFAQTATSPRATGPASSAQTATPSESAKPQSPSAARAGQLPAGHPAPQGHPATAGNRASPHGSTPAIQLVPGSPFDSDAHKRQAEAARAGQKFHSQGSTQAEKRLAPGTIGVLVRDGNRQPVVNKKVLLKGVREDIADGDRPFSTEAVTDENGHVGFIGQPTESFNRYEILVKEGSASYSSGEFRISDRAGQMVAIYVYPLTKDADESFVFSRALYVIEPRHNVFQVQGLFRIHNVLAKTWVPDNLEIALPSNAAAFRPGQSKGDVKLIYDNSRVKISGTFAPGQHDFSFGFQLPNNNKSNVLLSLPKPINLVDARVLFETGATMGLSVAGYNAPERTKTNEGKDALLTNKDYLRGSTQTAGFIQATITGMPTKGFGAIVAVILASLLALMGVAFSMSKDARKKSQVSSRDQTQARELILDELVSVEQAFKREEIGPKTYEQARRTLLDSLARIEQQLA